MREPDALAALTQRMDALEARNETLIAENRDLRVRLADRPDPPAPADAATTTEPGAPVGRRSLLRGGLAAGAAAAAGAVLLDGRPAAAATNDPLIMGSALNRCDNTTRWALNSNSRLDLVGGNGAALVVSSSASANTRDATGVFSNSSTYGSGVRGFTSNSGIGVIGDSGNGIGVEGFAPSGTGVEGTGATGVRGIGTVASGAGVAGRHLEGNGVAGVSSSGNGVSGRSTNGFGVLGEAPNGTGVVGSAYNGVSGIATNVAGHGVVGGNTLANATGSGVLALASSGTGLDATSASGTAVKATSTNGTALRLDARVPVDIIPREGPPVTGAHTAGQMWMEGDTIDGTLWLCVSSGTPGLWRKLAGLETNGALHVLPAPARVYDSRPGSAPTSIGPKTRFTANQTRTFDLKANSSGVPAGASAALVTLLLVNASSTPGNMTIWANGVTKPTANTLVWGGTAGRFTATATTALDTLARAQVNASAATDLVLDVVGYYR